MTNSGGSEATGVDPRTYYDRFAPGYEGRGRRNYHDLVDEIEVAMTLPFARGRRVLEVGCGTGLILNRISQVALHCEGIDLSDGMLAQARKRGLQVRQGSATDLPYPDASFDLCYSFKVLSHVPDIARAFAEMARVTRPGGTVLAELYNRHSLRWLARRLRGGRAVAEGLHDDELWTRFYSPAEMKALMPGSLEPRGLRGVRVLTAHPAMLDLPLLGAGLAWAERRSVQGPLARFGGFLVLEGRRR